MKSLTSTQQRLTSSKHVNVVQTSNLLHDLHLLQGNRTLTTVPLIIEKNQEYFFFSIAKSFFSVGALIDVSASTVKGIGTAITTSSLSLSSVFTHLAFRLLLYTTLVSKSLSNWKLDEQYVLSTPPHMRPLRTWKIC